MKSTLLTIIICAISITGLYAQNIMNVHQNNGTVIQIPLNTIDSITYTVGVTSPLPSVSTSAISGITDTSALSGGIVISEGASPVIQRGVCWSLNPNPTISNNFSIDGNGTGSFISELNGLIGDATYYVRAYALNDDGVSYGNEIVFQTTIPGWAGISSSPGPGVSFGGYMYPSIILGNGQEWMGENLRTSNYSNGDLIPEILNDSVWINYTSGAWSKFNNDSQFVDLYGKLYNWYSVTDSRNICPVGWHVPTDADWNILVGYLDSNFAPSVLGYQSNIVGGLLKSVTLDWESPNTNASNLINFWGLPSGIRFANGIFGGNGFITSWWSSTVGSTSQYGLSRGLEFNNGNMLRQEYLSIWGFPVRCLKD